MCYLSSQPCVYGLELNNPLLSGSLMYLDESGIWRDRYVVVMDSLYVFSNNTVSGKMKAWEEKKIKGGSNSIGSRH